MSAADISVSTAAFPDPLHDPRPVDEVIRPLPDYLGFTARSENVQILSMGDASPGAIAQGLLFVPDLISEDCIILSKGVIPNNVTRKENLPPIDYPYIAIAPWLSSTCALEYLAGTRNIALSAFVFYQPNNSTSAPPPPNEPAWYVGDGGDWKQTYNFPTLAIPGMNGTVLLQELAVYSQNISQIPESSSILQYAPGADYIRLSAEIQLGPVSGLPSLWTYILIVLGTLVGVICVISAVMHLIQRHRRKSLQRRIETGEVDLEALGVKRLTVPRNILDKMPTYQYSDRMQGRKDSLESSSVAGPTSAISQQAPAFAQTQCSICLEDFKSGEDDSQSLMVRELPCRHIFHTACIDPFFLQNSSLCPICKTSVLPQGCCPIEITNAIVTRERLVRRRRERIRRQNHPVLQAYRRRLLSLRQSPPLGSRHANSAPGHEMDIDPVRPRSQPLNTTEIRDTIQSPSALTEDHQCPIVASQSGLATSATSREDQNRANTTTFLDDEPATQTKWRKLIQVIFPR